MSITQPRLPHQADEILLTEGGTETWFMYKRGFKLLEFSAFPLATEVVDDLVDCSETQIAEAVRAIP